MTAGAGDLALHLDVTAVQIDDLLHVGQAETRPPEFSAAGFVYAVEPLEDAVEIAVRNADAAVLDGQHRIRAMGGDAHVDAGQPARTMELSKEQRASLRELHLITAKPVMYVANVSENGFHDNPYLDAVREKAASEGAEVVAVCAGMRPPLPETVNRGVHMGRAATYCRQTVGGGEPQIVVGMHLDLQVASFVADYPQSKK